MRELLSIAAGRKATMSEICGMLSEVGLCARDYVNREVNASLSGGELKRIGDRHDHGARDEGVHLR